MSIKLDQTINGVSVTDCIITVGAMTISHDRSSLNFNVGFYAIEGGPLLLEDYFVYEGYALKGDDPETQAYTYLKSLSRFSGAVDA
ncbi:hypothetical protein [Klebsiella grimontii]|uniref:hypothetical protein n=1 Tax=Klebsiella grimontii TaxID=2058152 RepID=UPI0007CCC100|nr:hypothetical protein [Klebsiella grimontii]HDX9078529.1 hypothetical protein [Klebsiella oxytoca]MDV1016247.1 hypothetical protein [Klebsiella grimontii]MDV1026950.1 hypothetical protein [Klebsiella grimontii]MDV1043519.1 hypothetical protein [Klebsiella grimontii]MDV1107992.1 hypothetical protein [Klebsiella grimontii]